MVKISFPSFFEERQSLIGSLRDAGRNLFDWRSYSLKKRVLLVFSFLVVFCIGATSFLLVQEWRASKMSSQVAAETRHQILMGSEILDTLAEIDQRARLGEPTEWEVRRFNDLIQRYGTELQRYMEAQDLLGRLQFRFQTYVNSLNDSHSYRGSDRANAQLRSNYQDVTNSVNALIELNANLTFRRFNEINSWNEKTTRVALYYLASFVLLSLIAGYTMIVAVTRPLSSLVNFLDRVNVEDDLPTETPLLQSRVPEIGLVAKSFEQLLQRLRGYRALNVRRLLIEKRRADIIAASISDGIFLLRGDEIVYFNPVAQRILMMNGEKGALGGSQSSSPLGMSLRSLAEAGATSTQANEDKGNRCARAILSAISQTMPVEMDVEMRDRKLYYLIQAYPISYDLIEQVEHSVKGPLEQVIDRFQANTIVVAQDVTLVRESQEAKGHFLATLSHEIKTPVTSLTMATRLLSKMIHEIPNPSHRNLILTCVEDVDRLRRLLDDLLTISRFDLMIQQLEFQSIDLVKLLKNSIQSFQVQARQRDISLTFSTQGKEGERMVKSLTVQMDPSKIAWAVSNLLTNALRHTPRGGAVEARLICTGEEWVEVRVKDSGPGIELKRQGKIFDKFSSFYDIRVARSGSAGAGLSIAREIVTAHGGRIWVLSEPGQGAEFGFTLPLKKQHSKSLSRKDSSKETTVAVAKSGDDSGKPEGPEGADGAESTRMAALAVSVSDSAVITGEDSTSLMKKGATSGASACR